MHLDAFYPTIAICPFKAILFFVTICMGYVIAYSERRKLLRMPFVNFKYMNKAIVKSFLVLYSWQYNESVRKRKKLNLFVVMQMS